jgi:hypothetical protein
MMRERLVTALHLALILLIFGIAGALDLAEAERIERDRYAAAHGCPPDWNKENDHVSTR